MHDSTGSKIKPSERQAEIQPASPEEREKAIEERRDRSELPDGRD